MRPEDYEELSSLIQNFLVRTRLDLKYSLERAAQLLEINESLLTDHETGKKILPSYELLKIMKRYQADLDQFELNVALLQIRHSRYKD